MTIANQLPWRNPNKMYTSINYKIISQSAGKKLIGDCDVFVLRDYVKVSLLFFFALLTNIIYNKNYQKFIPLLIIYVFFKLLKQTIFFNIRLPVKPMGL